MYLCLEEVGKAPTDLLTWTTSLAASGEERMRVSKFSSMHFCIIYHLQTALYLLFQNKTQLFINKGAINGQITEQIAY